MLDINEYLEVLAVLLNVGVYLIIMIFLMLMIALGLFLGYTEEKETKDEIIDVEILK